MLDIRGKKILVTGGTGHLGSAIIHHLVNDKGVMPADIRVFYLANSPTLSLNDIQGLDMVPGNILNAAEVQAAFSGVQLVFHTVGSTTFDSRQKRIQWLVNVEGTRNVLEAALNTPGFEKMCYTSTVNVLAIPHPVGSIGNFENSNPYINQPRLHSFTSAAQVLNFIEKARLDKAGWVNEIGIGYYDSKLAAQELVNDYVKRFGLNVTSILPGTMFGPYDCLIGTGMYLLALYRNQMPVVLKGGFPLAHVMDVAAGQILAMQKATAGSRYILSGREEDNRTLRDMCKIIVEVLSNRFPNKKIKSPQLVVPRWLALVAAFFSEQFSVLFNRPMLLSRDAVRPGSYPSFYTSLNAIEELGYNPQRTFRQAVHDMLDYYIAQNLIDTPGRWIDRR